MIDSAYEYAGYSLAAQVSGVLSGVALPLIVALVGTAALVHAVASERAGIRDLGVHILALALLAALLVPVRDGEITAPRLALWLGRAADLLQHRIVARVHERFLSEPYEFERLAALAASGRIHDAALRDGVGRFLEACAKPALAAAAPAGPNLLRPGILPYSGPCEQERAGLWQRLRDHAGSDPLHRAVLHSGARMSLPAQAEAFLERYLDQVVQRTIDEPGGALSESALVAASLGEYGSSDLAQSASSGLGYALDRIVDRGVTWLAAFEQDWDNRFAAKQKYYLATLIGPHVYGLSLLFLIGLFPAAALFALLPGRWRALVNWAKVFVSVKLWPVCWAVLTTFNAQRSPIEALDAPERTRGDVFLAVAFYYLLTPAVSFLVVKLSSDALAMPFAGAVPAAAGAPMSPVGAALAGARVVRGAVPK